MVPSPPPAADDPTPSAWTPPPGIQVYAGAVSVLPGEPIALKVSTTADTFTTSLALVTATGERIVYRGPRVAGHDWRQRVSVDPETGAVRAQWPTSITVPTSHFQPGIYIVTATDSRDSSSHAIVVVRTPVLDPTKPAFVYDALTQAAYDSWGGSSFYYPSLATTVTFDRPLTSDGLGVWPQHDSRLVQWLLARRPDLQFTTDFDLGLMPPPTAPRTLILGFHTEYVPLPFRDWVVRHVDTLGDMNLAIFGANSFYWRVRLEPGPTPGAPAEMTCYKLAPASDPLSATSPTGRYRMLGEPEGTFIGSQYMGMVASERRFETTVTTDMPPELLAGTDWHAGTVLRGIVTGEADSAYPGTGSTTIAATTALDRANGLVSSGMVIRVAPSGGRVFDAGTFGLADGLSPARIDIGVGVGTFDRFMRNILDWLGTPAVR